MSALPGFPAVHLFAERARAVRPDFQVTPTNAEAVVEIVRRLDGIPLALELAAARVNVLSPEQIVSRLSDRFRILSGGARTALPASGHYGRRWTGVTTCSMRRNNTVAAPVGVHGQLQPRCGRSDLRSGRHRGMDVLDVVSRLVDKSLVVVVQGPENRYRLLETVRQYGRERLEETGESEGPAPPIATGAPRWWKPLPTRSVEVAGRRAGWSCWNSSTTTYTPPWSGRGAAVTPQSPDRRERCLVLVSARSLGRGPPILGAEHRGGGRRTGSD